MTGEEMLSEIARREYYRERERKNNELMACAWFCFKIGVIAACLMSIAEHVQELYRAF